MRHLITALQPKASLWGDLAGLGLDLVVAVNDPLGLVVGTAAGHQPLAASQDPLVRVAHVSGGNDDEVDVENLLGGLATEVGEVVAATVLDNQAHASGLDGRLLDGADVAEVEDLVGPVVLGLVLHLLEVQSLKEALEQLQAHDTVVGLLVLEDGLVAQDRVTGPHVLDAFGVEDFVDAGVVVRSDSLDFGAKTYKGESSLGRKC